MALLCLCIAIALLVVPAAAGTEYVNVTKYCDNNYAVVDSWENFSYQDLMAIGQYQSNGEIQMQGLVTPGDWAQSGLNESDFQNGWDATESMNFKPYGAHNGTLVENIVEQIGGMPDGSELEVADSTYPKATRHFSKTNVYTPPTGQGEMVLCWWDSVDGLVPNWGKGMRLYFYTPEDLELSNMDMKEAFAPWYYQFSKDKYSDFVGPSAKGLSVQTVDTINIYPPHRYDFATGGDTFKYAYEGGVNASPGLNDPSGTTVNTSMIAADDGNYDWFNTSTSGEYAAQRFVFTLNESATNIEKLAVTWDGTSSHDNTSANQGATTYIWKNGTGYETLSGDITSNIGDYVVNGNVTVLVKQNALSERNYQSCIATDYVKLVVTNHHTN
jgi:hypothetical protein